MTSYNTHREHASTITASLLHHHIVIFVMTCCDWMHLYLYSSATNNLSTFCKMGLLLVKQLIQWRRRVWQSYLIYLFQPRPAPTETNGSLPVPPRSTTLGNCLTIQIIYPTIPTIQSIFLSLDLNLLSVFELPCSAESHTAIAAEDRRLNEHGAPLP